MLLRYSSLVLDTIRFHRDYQVLCPRERTFCKKQMLVVFDELESLKPEVDRQVDGLNIAHSRSQDYQQNGIVKNNVSFGSDSNQSPNMTILPSMKRIHGSSENLQSRSIDMQFQNLSLLPPPKQETLLRHFLFGPNGHHKHDKGPAKYIKQWRGIKPKTRLPYLHDVGYGRFLGPEVCNRFSLIQRFKI